MPKAASNTAVAKRCGVLVSIRRNRIAALFRVWPGPGDGADSGSLRFHSAPTCVVAERRARSTVISREALRNRGTYLAVAASVDGKAERK